MQFIRFAVIAVRLVRIVQAAWRALQAVARAGRAVAAWGRSQLQRAVAAIRRPPQRAPRGRGRRRGGRDFYIYSREDDMQQWLETSPEVVAHLAQVAGRVAASAAQRAPGDIAARIYTRAGIGRRGPFAQVVARHPGAVAVEFGSINNPPHAFLRGALMVAR